MSAITLSKLVDITVEPVRRKFRRFLMERELKLLYKDLEYCQAQVHNYNNVIRTTVRDIASMESALRSMK